MRSKTFRNKPQRAGPEPTSNGESGSVSKPEMSSEEGPNAGLSVAVNGAATADPAGALGGVEASAAAESVAHAPEAPAAHTDAAPVPVAHTDAAPVPVAHTDAAPVPVAHTDAAPVPVAHTDAAAVPVAPTDADPAPGPAPARKATPSVEELSAVVSSIHAWLSRPRVRLIVTGAMLLLLDGLFLTNSVWTLPLVIVGVLMIVIGWVGGRLDGRFTVEWGKTGTQLEFRARIAAPPPGRPSLPPAASLPRAPDTQQPTPDDGGIIEAEAHTVESDLAELEALIAAAETAEAQGVHTDAPTRALHKLHAARGRERSSDDLR
jgi:hypothetical protein